jgi:hypothetical protein
MRGFLKNETGRSVFKLQRPLPVNGVLSFDDAYLTLGEKSGKKEGQGFVKWLKDTHFPDEGWVFYREEGVLFFPKPKQETPVKEEVKEIEVSPDPPKAPRKKIAAKGAGKKLRQNANKKRSSKKSQEIVPGDVINADLPQAKELLSKIKDRQVLKRALSLSNHFSNKEEHRRLINRRLEEVY